MNLHQRLRGGVQVFEKSIMVKALRIVLSALVDPVGINDAFLALSNVMVRSPGLLATRESDEKNPPLFGTGGTGLVYLPQGPTISMIGHHFISDADLELKMKQCISTIEEIMQSCEGVLVYLRNGHGMMTIARHLTCRAYGLSWSSLYLNEDPDVLQPDFTKYRDMRTQSSEFVRSSNDNLSEYGISMCKGIKDVFGTACNDGIKVMLSTCPLLIGGLRSPGYGLGELLAPAPMIVNQFGHKVCHYFVGAMGNSDAILGKSVFQYTRFEMSFQNELELQEVLGSLPGMSSSVITYFLTNNDLIIMVIYARA